jgi:hypothetical protein
MKMEMTYNSELEPLLMPEYGRNVQKMVSYLLKIDNRELRNQQAQNVISVMGNLNPHLRDTPDFQHKLWDHLFIMSAYQLDVDSPYPIPKPEELSQKPEPLQYPKGKIRYRHYGRNILQMIDYAKTIEDEEEQQTYITAVCNVMKNSYILWNNKMIEDEVIIAQFQQLSGNYFDISSEIKLKNMYVKRKKNHTQNRNHRKRS